MIRSENLSAPVASDTRARLAVFAAAVPKAAANLRPDPKAVKAICSAAFIASDETTRLDWLLSNRPRVLREEGLGLLGFRGVVPIPVKQA